MSWPWHIQVCFAEPLLSRYEPVKVAFWGWETANQHAELELFSEVHYGFAQRLPCTTANPW